MSTLEDLNKANEDYRAADDLVRGLVHKLRKSADEVENYVRAGSQHGYYQFLGKCPSADEITTALTKLFAAKYLAQEAWGALSEADQSGTSRPR
jgi:hypothetical protein